MFSDFLSQCGFNIIYELLFWGMVSKSWNACLIIVIKRMNIQEHMDVGLNDCVHIWLNLQEYKNTWNYLGL